MTGNTNTRNCNKTTTSALRPMERARGQDYAGAAECFVDAFFLKRNGGGDRITKSELAYLNGAQRKDLVSRYNQKNKGVMFVIKDADTNKVVGCVGAEVQKFVVNVPLRRAESDGELAVTERPVIANLAVDSAFRKQGIAKALMRAIEEECLEWGYTETVLVVEAKNKQAIGLYKKSGYKPVLTEAVRAFPVDHVPPPCSARLPVSCLLTGTGTCYRGNSYEVTLRLPCPIPDIHLTKH
jgi:ribosomal protein S18 acetylase RimI-like enzyme